MKKTALITGITGQDGSYLAEFLLKKVTQFMEWLEEWQQKINLIDFGDLDTLWIS